MRILLFFLLINMGSDFQIINRSDCSSEGINSDNVVRTYILECNNATVGELEDGRYVVIPLCGDLCISTSNLQLLESWISAEKFPIGLETSDPMERIQLNTEKLDYYVRWSKWEISNLFDIQDADKLEFEVLDSVINSSKSNLNIEELDSAYVALNFYLIERFRSICNVPIKLKKIETLNSYYIPVLDFSLSSGLFKEFSFRRDVTDALTSGGKLYSEASIKLALIEYYNLNPFGDQAKSLLKDRLK